MKQFLVATLLVLGCTHEPAGAQEPVEPGAAPRVMNTGIRAEIVDADMNRIRAYKRGSGPVTVTALLSRETQVPGMMLITIDGGHQIPMERLANLSFRVALDKFLPDLAPRPGTKALRLRVVANDETGSRLESSDLQLSVHD